MTSRRVYRNLRTDTHNHTVTADIKRRLRLTHLMGKKKPPPPQNKGFYHGFRDNNSPGGY